MKTFKRTVLVSCCVILLIGVLVLPSLHFRGTFAAAQSTTRHRQSSAQGPGGVEKDDPMARLKAERDARGQSTAATAQALMEQAKHERDDHPGRTSQGGQHDRNNPQWLSNGPASARREQNGPFDAAVVDSGRLRTILVDSRDEDKVYLLSSGGGLWRTDNFTDSRPEWQSLTDSVGSTSGGSVALSATSNTLYLGAGDPFDPAPGGFMIKSRNRGEDWSDPVFLSGATTILDVKVISTGEHDDADTVLVGTDNGLFRSVDSGETYRQVSSLSFGRNQVWSLVNTSAGWLASSQADPTGNGVPSLGVTTMYLSTDRGATWTATGSGLPANTGRTTLGVGAPGDHVVYAFAAAQFDPNVGFDQLDLFRSTDGGRSWTALGVNGNKVPVNPNPDQPGMDLMNGQAWYNQMILVDPRDAARNTVYIGGQLSTAKTTDGGQTWAIITNWLGFFGLPYAHADFHCAAFSPMNNNILFGSDGGIFVSRDNGATLDNAKNDGLVDHLVYSVTSEGKDPDQTLIGLQDDGTRYRTPHTTNWNQVFGGDGLGTGWSQANNDVSFCTVAGDFYFRSLTNPPDQQSKFIDADNNDILDFTFNFHTPLVTPNAQSDPTGNVFFTYTGTFIWRTVDEGGHWISIANIDESPIFPGNIHAGPPFTMFFRDVTHGLGVSSDLSHVGVASTGGRVALSGDGGATWSVVSLNSEVPGFSSFTSNVTWSSNSTVFVTSLNQNPAAVHVVKSTRGGAPGSWTAAQTGLPAVPVTRLRVDPRDRSGQTIYAATHLGVYRTTNGGASWDLFGTGLPQVAVTDIYTSPDGSRVQIATFGRGVWEVNFNNEQEGGDHQN
jgi:hypothetical protein